MRWVAKILRGSLVLFLITTFQLTRPATAENALERYLAQKDPAYSWTIKEKKTLKGITEYNLLLVSQNWKDIVWTHQLGIVVPDSAKNSRYALLFIAGGSNKDGQPKWKNVKSAELEMLGRVAQKCGAPVAVLGQVPNQPLYGDRREDSLISYTFEQFMKTKDDTWPLLLPMVKSAVQAMNAMQELGEKEWGNKIEKFVVSGASKRGWTTWLTGATDPRVTAIAPMVIDILNMSVQLDYQKECLGEFSEQIEDYVKLDLPKKMKEPDGQVLLGIVDPYSYRERLTQPKFLFMGTNDPYWTIDAVKWYFDDLKGEKAIHYIPNVGHNLGNGKEAVQNLAAYFGAVVKGEKLPEFQWTAENQDKNVEMKLTFDRRVKELNLWSAASDTRDFRQSHWRSTDCMKQSATGSAVRVRLPREGYKAFYVEAVFPSLLGGKYSQCTRTYVADQNGVIDKNK